MKRAILVLSILSILLFIVGFGLAFTAAAGGCTTTAEGAANCSTGAAAGAGIGVLVYVLGGLCATVAWILGLIKTATVKAWGWFVLVLLLSPLGSLIYGAAGPDQAA